MPESSQPQSEEVPAATPAPVPPPAEPAAAPTKRPRRWVRRLALGALVLLLLLAVLIGFAPAIASTPTVCNTILSVVNGRLQGTLQVEGLSLAWGGPTEIRGLRMTDSAQQQVLQIPRATAAAGVWRLLSSAMAFGEITIDSPVVLIEQKRDGEITLAQAFRPRRPSSATPPAGGPLPEPKGRLTVTHGVVKVVRAGAGAYELTDINAVVELQTLNEIAGKINLALADGARLAGETTIRQLVSQGELDAHHANGTLRLATARNTQVGPLAALAGQAGLAGGTSLDVDATLDAGKLQGRFVLDIVGLQSAQRAATQAAPLDAHLRGAVNWADRKLAASLDLASAAGQAQAELAYQQADKPLNIAVDQIVSAVLTGQSLTCPDFTLKVQANFDLAKLGQAVPELLSVRAGTELTGGRLELANLTIRGGAQPAASAAIELQEVTARRGDTPVRLEPIALKLDSTLEGGQGLQVRQLELTSRFVQVQARGSASDLRATFKASLGNLHRELNQVFDLGAFELGAELNGTVELKRASDEQVNLGLQATAEQIRYAGGGRVFELPRASITHTGQLGLVQQRLTRVLAQETRLDLNGELIATASGWYDIQQAGFKTDVTVSRGDLGFVARQAKGLGLAALARYSGDLRLQVSAARAGGTQPVSSSGELVVQNLGIDRQSVADGDTKMKWEGVQLAADGSSLQVAAAQLESTLAQLTAKEVKWKSGSTLSLAGQVDGTADVARCLKAVTPMARWEKPPELAGRLVFNTSGRAAGDVLTLAGQGGIESFVIGTGASAIREERLQFAYAAQLDQARKSVLINQCNLASQPLTAELAGTVGGYPDNCQLDLHGRYTASWEALTALLHQLVPSTASTVIVTGTSTSAFKVTGPARQAGAQPGFRGVSTEANVTWTSAELYGVKMGAAQFAPALKDGQATLPRTVIPAADGKVHLGAVLDFQPPDPTLKLLGQMQLLENVAVTRELGAQLLSRINPIFLQVANIEGRVNLGVQDVLAPLGPSLAQHGAGRGRLDLSNMKMQPGGLLAELLSLGGLPQGTAYPVQIGALEFRMQDGRILYDHFKWSFPGEFELDFRGSVGLDETLDLIVSVPVRAALLDKLGAKGPTQEYAKMLSGARVDIPIIGTRAKPQLDLSKVDVQKLLKDVLLKEQPTRQIEDLLKGLPTDKHKKQ